MLSKSRKIGSIIESWFRLIFDYQRTFINTRKVTENWFCNKITVQAKSPFEIDFY